MESVVTPRAWLTACVAILTLLVAPVASAATVETGDFLGQLEIAAPAGETNDLTLSGERAGGITTIDVIEGGAAPLEAGAGCEDTKTGVRCELDSVYVIFVELGDMSDHLDGSGIPGGIQITADLGDGDDEMLGPPNEACVDAGEGDDRVTLIDQTLGCAVDGEGGDDEIVAATGRNNLYGGLGADRIVGGDGTDNIEGDEGNDRLLGGPGGDFIGDGDGEDLGRGGGGRDFFSDDPGNDVLEGNQGSDVFGMYLGPRDGDDLLDGGKGTDSANFLCRSCRVSLDGRANDGRKGEQDNLLVENVRIRSTLPGDGGGLQRFGSGQDRIEGDDGSNVLAGYRGADRISGNGGADDLLGGTGNDQIKAADGERDIVDCGAGKDSASVDAFDVVRRCESLSVP